MPLRTLDLLLPRLFHLLSENLSYYWILYYAYLSPQQCQNTEEVIELLRPHIRDISRTTYFRKQEQAVQTLSAILRGYTSKDSMEILAGFIPPQALNLSPRYVIRHNRSFLGK